MRFMLMAKADQDSEAGVLPSPRLMTEMGVFMEEIVKAGVLLATEGLQPSSKGKRVRFQGGKRTVIDGPFAETKELIANFALIEVKSMDEAIEWAARFAKVVGDVEIEIRPVFEASDFPPDLFPAEDAAREEALREEMQRQAAKP